jgi:hypothetical protein
MCAEVSQFSCDRQAETSGAACDQRDASVDLQPPGMPPGDRECRGTSEKRGGCLYRGFLCSRFPRERSGRPLQPPDLNRPTLRAGAIRQTGIVDASQRRQAIRDGGKRRPERALAIHA